MRNLAGRTALLTGASRGIGPHIARALARAGLQLVLAARAGAEVEAVAAELRAGGARAVAVRADVGDPAGQEELVDRAQGEFGAVDVLVNNAGLLITSAYHHLQREEIRQAIAVNLTAPMLLAHLCLPGMLARGRGHIVNLSSLAGKAGPPYNAPYAATKAALIGFTQSLRSEYRGTGVSASVICPGFVRDAGMYHRTEAEAGMAAPRLLGTSTPAAVARAVVRAIEQDLPEVIVNPVPVRLALACGQVFPRLAEALLARSGVTEMYRRAAAARQGSRPGP